MSMPVLGQGAMPGFWSPGLPCFAIPWVISTSPAGSVQGNLTQIQRFQKLLWDGGSLKQNVTAIHI